MVGQNDRRFEYKPFTFLRGRERRLAKPGRVADHRSGLMAVSTTDPTLPRADPAPRRKIDARRLVPVVVVVLATLSWLGYRAWSARQPFEWSGTIEAA
jgi:hypothetical protein